MRQINDWVGFALIPVIFIGGISLFFLLLPSEAISITNFVAYAASWSTVVMVLIYVFTNSRQLKIMQRQISEMNLTRNVQFQPLVYPKEPKVECETPQYFGDPATEFKKMEFCCRIYVTFKVANLGNGPAVELDFLPKIITKTWDRTGSKPKEQIKELKVEGLGPRIECISLGEGDSKDVNFLLFDSKAEFFEALLNSGTYIFFDVIFKNVLGMTFKETCLLS